MKINEKETCPEEKDGMNIFLHSTWEDKKTNLPLELMTTTQTVDGVAA